MKKFSDGETRNRLAWVGKVGRILLPFCLGSALTLLVVYGTVLKKNSKLLELEHVIDRYFVEDVDQEPLMDAAADAMVNALGDRWSYYMTPEEYKTRQETMNSSYVGVGITISLRENGSGYEITRVEQDGPASQAGIQMGDILIGADEVRVDTNGADAVREAVAGEQGTEVLLTVLRNGKTLQFNVKRDVVLVDVAWGELLEGNIGLVTIDAFHARAAEETIQAVEDLLEQGAEALIFDVRNNPGGYTSELIALLDYLLPEGPIFRTQDYAGTEHVDYSDADCLELPMAVLVNGNSYSAAEFFAAAMQEYDAAVIVGEKTTGKGRYQTSILLQDGSAVNLSVGRYFTPEGVDLTGVGITPDLEITVDAETDEKIYGRTLKPQEDPQILGAIAELKSGN